MIVYSFKIVSLPLKLNLIVFIKVDFLNCTESLSDHRGNGNKTNFNLRYIITNSTR